MQSEAIVVGWIAITMWSSKSPLHTTAHVLRSNCSAGDRLSIRSVTMALSESGIRSLGALIPSSNFAELRST